MAGGIRYGQMRLQGIDELRQKEMEELKEKGRKESR
jgi:hypothetical protein